MKKNTFLEGTFIATLAIVLVKILGIIYVIPFYAIVGVTGATLYAYAYNIYAIFLDISGLGVPMAMSKIVSEYHTLGQNDAKNRAFSLGKKLVLYVSVASFIILFVFANSIASALIGGIKDGLGVKDVAFVIRSISFSILIIPYLAVGKGYLQGHNFITPSSVSQLLEQVVRIIFILLGSYLTLKVFHLSLKTSIGIAVFGAFAGGLVALIYIYCKIVKNNKKLNTESEIPKENISDKTIIKKIISYAMPFIIIDTTYGVYNYINMILISKGLVAINYTSGSQIQFIVTSITTWAPKINMIIIALATGMITSLIPSIVSAYSLKKMDEVNDKFNKALQIIMLISLPMTIGGVILSDSIWTCFYGANQTGSLILKATLFIALFNNLFLIIVSTLQSVNKIKEAYFIVFAGFILNAMLDIPLIYLFNYMRLPAFLGGIVATIIGYIVSVIIALIKLKKLLKFEYQKTIQLLIKLTVPLLMMILIVSLTNYLVPHYNKMTSLVNLFMGVVLGSLVYFFILFKQKTMQEIFGDNFLQKLKKKLIPKRTSS